jgi:hypothetical protein
MPDVIMAKARAKVGTVLELDTMAQHVILTIDNEAKLTVHCSIGSVRIVGVEVLPNSVRERPSNRTIDS